MGPCGIIEWMVKLTKRWIDETGEADRGNRRPAMLYERAKSLDSRGFGRSAPGSPDPERCAGPFSLSYTVRPLPNQSCAATIGAPTSAAERHSVGSITRRQKLSAGARYSPGMPNQGAPWLTPATYRCHLGAKRIYCYLRTPVGKLATPSGLSTRVGPRTQPLWPIEAEWGGHIRAEAADHRRDGILPVRSLSSWGTAP